MLFWPARRVSNICECSMQYKLHSAWCQTSRKLSLMQATRSTQKPRLNVAYFTLVSLYTVQFRRQGLQMKYNNPDNHWIKEYTHMLIPLAFMPEQDVVDTFALLKRTWTEADSKLIVFVNGTPVQGVTPRSLQWFGIIRTQCWDKRCKTNDVSKAWHNCFAIVVRKHHSDLYSALRE